MYPIELFLEYGIITIRIFILIRLEYEGVMQSSNQKDMATYAMDRYAYYVCFKCSKVYYGGEARCDAEMGDKYNPQELICGACSDVARAKVNTISFFFWCIEPTDYYFCFI